MGQFDRQIATALRLIKKNGEPCIWYSAPEPLTGDGNDPANPADDGDEVPHPVSIVFLTSVVGSRAIMALSSLLGVDVPEGGYFGLMGQVNFTPKLTDRIERSDGSSLNLSDNGFQELKPNGQSILFTLRFAQ